MSHIMWVVALALLFGMPVNAQDEEAWYTVELVVFERSGEAGLYSETWPEEPELPDLSDAVEISAAGGLSPLEPLDEDPVQPPEDPSESLVRPLENPIEDLVTPLEDGPRAFQRLAPEEFELIDVWQSLEKSKQYRPLLHVGWRQPGYAQEQSKLAHVRNDNGALGRGQSADSQQQTEATMISDAYLVPTFSARGMIARDPTKPALDGTIRLHRARYLHVHADLLYYRPLDEDLTSSARGESIGGATPITVDSAGAALVEQLLAEEPRAATVFRLNESRRMRSTELHYLDHPLFGILVQVRPYELPEEIMLPMEPDTPVGGEAEPASSATGESGG